MRRLAEEIADRRDFAVLEDLARARRHMQSAIAAYAEILTGDREYFWSKPYSAAERSRDQGGS